MMKNNIRVERAVLRISQQELADAVGVSRQTIYAIENGKFIPSTELALKLSANNIRDREREVHPVHGAGPQTVGLFREDGQ